MNPDDAQDPPPLKGIKLAVAAFTLSTGYFLVMLDMTIANVSVPHIAGSLGASPTQGTWVITSYAVADAICLPLTGWLARRLGTVRAFMLGMAGFMLSSLLCGLAQNLSTLVVFRIIQGISGAPLVPLCQTLLLRVFPKDKAGLALSMSAVTTVIAPIAGPVVGGAITDNYSWRYIFFLNIPFVIVALILMASLIRPFETKRILQPIDFVGLILLAVWVGALQLMFDLGREHDWFASGMIVMLAIVALIGFCAFLIWELTEANPIIDLRVLRHRGFWAASLCISTIYANIMMGVVLVPLWVQTVMGYTAVLAGMIMAPMSLFSLLCIPLSARMSRLSDARMIIFLSICWFSLVAIARTQISTDLTMGWLSVPQFMQGMTTAFYVLGLTVIALGSVEQHEVANAAGLMAFMRVLGVGASISWATTIWDNGTSVARTELVGRLHDAEATMQALMDQGMTHMQARVALARLVEAQSSTMALNHVFMVSAVLCLVAALMVWIVPANYKAGPVRKAH